MQCSFSGWGQFLQSFCRSTSEFVISRVAKSHSQIARPLAKSNFLIELKTCQIKAGVAGQKNPLQVTSDLQRVFPPGGLTTITM